MQSPDLAANDDINTDKDAISPYPPDTRGVDPDHVHEVEWSELIRIGLVVLAAAAVWFRVWEPISRLSVIGIVATLISGYPIFKEAFENLVERKMTMELSMTIALFAALAIGEFFTALVITAFVLAAEVLERLTVDRGRRAIQNLLDFLPRTATVRRNGHLAEIPSNQLQVADRLLVKPGGYIPVDGFVLDGRSFVEQAAITGEPMPVEKFPGAAVYAGTINQSGALEIRAERLGRDTTFGRIVEAVEQAEQSRAPIQKIADRLAGYLVYFALSAAVLTFLITHNLRSTISVVIVAGACGIAAGTPLAILGAIGQAARQGAIVKGGLYLETLAAIDTVLLDKTGTLTFGIPQVKEVLSIGGFSEREVIRVAAIAERKSEHPLAKAVLRRADELRLAAADTGEFSYSPGRGVRVLYQGEEILVGSRTLLMQHGVKQILPVENDDATAIFVARAGQFLGVIRVSDVVRPEAKQAVQAMHRMGLKTVLLSGDTQSVTASVAQSLGVDTASGELLPDQKAKYIRDLRAKKRKIAMVGDGINDAPALVEANVGVAMGSGTDVARESADVVLIGSDLSKFVQTVKIARSCRGIIMQNFIGTLVVDSIGVAMAAFGYLNPLLAAFIHVASELTFILNSTRLLPRTSESRSPGVMAEVQVS
jgi:heavy metal translocating P-type ATPase